MNMLTPSASPEAQSSDSLASTGEPARTYDLYSWSTKSSGTRLVYIQSATTADVAISQLNSKILGFDLEWKPNFVKGNPDNPVALVQLASEDTILLIHLTFMSTFPVKLKELLLDSTVIKAGVGIQNDCKKLFNDHGVDTRNCVDLSLLARTVDNKRWKGKYSSPIGLSRLCETYEELTLIKGKVQLSNWERPLDLRQQEYAANDCHAGLVLYKRLATMITEMTPAPHRVWYTFDTISGHLYQPSTGVLWHAFNPYYDPGPPPPPRPPKVQNGEGNGHDHSHKSGRGSRFSRHNRTRSGRPLSPNATSFVPGAKEHSPSPSPSPLPGFASTPRSQPPFPLANEVVTPTPMLSADLDGFPLLIRNTRALQQQQQPRSRPFHGAGNSAGPVHLQANRGRGRGRAYAIAVAQTG